MLYCHWKYYSLPRRAQRSGMWIKLKKDCSKKVCMYSKDSIGKRKEAYVPVERLSCAKIDF